MSHLSGFSISFSNAFSIPVRHLSSFSIQSPQNLRMAEGDLSQEDVCGYARNSDYLHASHIYISFVSTHWFTTDASKQWVCWYMMCAIMFQIFSLSYLISLCEFSLGSRLTNSIRRINSHTIYIFRVCILYFMIFILYYILNCYGFVIHI